MSYAGAGGAFMQNFVQGKRLGDMHTANLQRQDDLAKREPQKAAIIGTPQGLADVSEVARQQAQDQEDRMAATAQRGESAGTGIDPMQIMSIGKSIMGGSGGAAAGEGGAAAGSSSGAAGGSGGGMAAAGPWAALAAVIYGNEKYASDNGYRREGADYKKDLLTGKVLSQDVDQRWSPKVFGENDRTGMGAEASGAASLMSFQPKKAFKEFKNGTLGKVMKSIFD